MESRIIIRLNSESGDGELAQIEQWLRRYNGHKAIMTEICHTPPEPGEMGLVEDMLQIAVDAGIIALVVEAFVQYVRNRAESADIEATPTVEIELERTVEVEGDRSVTTQRMVLRTADVKAAEELLSTFNAKALER